MSRMSRMYCIRVVGVGIAFVAALGAPSVLWAETEIGNGGDAIVCAEATSIPGSPHVTAEVYEAFEARVLMDLPASFGPGADPVAMARFAAQRLATLDPVRAQRLIVLIERFMSEARIVPRANLTDIPDTDPSVVPLGCSLRQLAIQYRDPAPRMPRYLIDKDLWDLLDVSNQAYLILHEVIYYETIRRGATDSKTARLYNAHLASDIFTNWSQADYDDFIVNALSLPTLAEVDGLTLNKATLVYDDAGILLMGTLSGTEYFTPVTDSRTWRKGDRSIVLDSGTSVFFAAGKFLWKGKGTVMTARSGVPYSRVPVMVRDTASGFEYASSGVPFAVSPTGEVTFASTWTTGLLLGNPAACHAVIDASGNTAFSIGPDGMPAGHVLQRTPAKALVGSDAECATGSGRDVFFETTAGSYEFFPNGHLKRAKVIGQPKLLDQAGQEVMLNQGAAIELDMGGRLVQVN